MGTSTSSSGPGAGVRLVPPWVQADGPDPVVPHPITPPENTPTPPQGTPTATPQLPGEGQAQEVVMALPRRFFGARRGIGRFAQTGESGDLKRGLGHYVRGIGGGKQGVRRMATTVRTANALFNTLSALRLGQTAGLDLGVNPASLAGRPAKEVMDVIIEAIRPNDGTQDSEANRMSIASATSDLLTEFPNVDLTAITSEQIDLLIERYIAQALCQRIERDVGRTLQARAATAAEAIRRLDAIKDYINSEVQSQFVARRARGEHLQRNQVGKLVAEVMLDVFYVFEGYLS